MDNEDISVWDKAGALKGIKLLYQLSTNNSCLFGGCGYREKTGWVIPHPKQHVSIYELIPKFLFHYKTCHGVDPELLIEYLKK